MLTESLVYHHLGLIKYQSYSCYSMKPKSLKSSLKTIPTELQLYQVTFHHYLFVFYISENSMYHLGWQFEYLFNPEVAQNKWLFADSSTFSWFKKSTTTTSSTTTTTASTTLSTTSIKNELAKTFFNKFSSRFNVKNNYNHLSSLPGLRNKAENANVMMILEKEDVKGITEFTPLTIGSIIVGIVVSILLIISVITLIVSKVRRQSRRRSQHTRCQAAIRFVYS